MDYGFWSILANDAGEEPGYTGPFDIVMAFFFYLPNLAVAELFIRGAARPGPVVRSLAALAMLAAIGLIGLGTYYFAAYYWLPGLAMRIARA